MKKLCACGCGQEVTNGKKWVQYHHTKGPNHPGWKGGSVIHKGYKMVRHPNHPRAHSNGYIKEHILKAENALGKLLPIGAVVHHYTVDQLVICQNDTYHKLLHYRQRAYEASGHADWLKCKYCKQYDDPINMYYSKVGSYGWHKNCRSNYRKNYIPKPKLEFSIKELNELINFK